MEEKLASLPLMTWMTFISKCNAARTFLHNTHFVTNDIGCEIEHIRPWNKWSLLLGLLISSGVPEHPSLPSSSMWAPELPCCLLIVAYHDGDGFP